MHLESTYPAVARPAGFEPATVRLEGGCSIQLSYGHLSARLPVFLDATAVHRRFADPQAKNSLFAYEYLGSRLRRLPNGEEVQQRRSR